MTVAPGWACNQLEVAKLLNELVAVDPGSVMVKVGLLVGVLIDGPIDKLMGLAGKPLSPKFDMTGDDKSTGRALEPSLLVSMDLAVSSDPLRSPNKACTAVSLKPWVLANCAKLLASGSGEAAVITAN